MTPRSAKTLPELGTTFGLFFLFVISHLIVRPGFIESCTGQFDISPGSLYATRRLFLESMKHVNSSLKFDRVNRPKGVCAKVLDHLKDPWALAPPRFRVLTLSPKLSTAETRSNIIDHSLWETQLDVI